MHAARGRSALPGRRLLCVHMRLAVLDKRIDPRCRGLGPSGIRGPKADSSGRILHICTARATHTGPAAPCGDGAPPDPARRPAAIGAAADSPAAGPRGPRALHAHKAPA